jgi:hypothetical protein
VATGPSIHVVRARKLLYGGLVGGVAATVICLIIFGITQQGRGLLTVLIAAGIALFFYAAGQFVMVMFADAGARTLMLISLLSYSTRIIVLGLILMSYSNNRDAWPSLSPMAFFVTTIAVVGGWLAVEIFVFSRLRIGAYDTEYTAPESPAAKGEDQ